MSSPDEQDDFKPSFTPGYKPGAAKTAEEYANLDANDESLARWKASLGITAGATTGNASGPKLTVLALELQSPTLPPGKKLAFDLSDRERVSELKKNPITIKEGVEYNVQIRFKVNHSIISISVDKLEQMLGSYGPHPQGESYTKNFDPEESPSGILARSGTYHVRSRVVDDDGEVYADWEWSFKLGKECPFINPSQSNARWIKLTTPRHDGPVSTVPSSPTTWIDRLPARIRPYLHLTRIDKPIGTLLLFYPCTWSITMASYALEAPLTTSLGYIGLFGLGALVMRGAGCTINDMWDKNLDKAVERTKTRPLAQGDLTRRQALVFLGGQLAVGLGVLLQLNWYSIFLGASSLSVVTIYPFMKRITYWPQAVLGLTFNWGALLGWSAVAGTVNWDDKTDDVNAGIRSTALLFGEQTRPVLGVLSTSAMSLITYAGLMNAQGAPFYVGVGLGAAQLARILWRTDFDNRASCWKGFVGCGWSGFWIWMGALADYGTKIAGML
ncbi:hypothetical protein ID866_2736 [Astraeus odoratus]|nr:hypothetical protein ID866_2736 [Astraeus odoratus]